MTHLGLNKTLAENGDGSLRCTLNGDVHHPARNYYFYSSLCYVLLGLRPI